MYVKADGPCSKRAKLAAASIFAISRVAMVDLNRLKAISTSCSFVLPAVLSPRLATRSARAENSVCLNELRTSLGVNGLEEISLLGGMEVASVALDQDPDSGSVRVPLRKAAVLYHLNKQVISHARSEGTEYVVDALAAKLLRSTSVHPASSRSG